MQQGQERRRQNNEVGETRSSSPQKKFWESAFSEYQYFIEIHCEAVLSRWPAFVFQISIKR